MYNIKIQEHTPIRHISQHWKPMGNDVVIFEVTKASSFKLFAEGVALGKLRDFELGGLKIHIDLQQSPLSGDEKEKIDSEKLPPILSTLFGLELLHIAVSVKVLGNDLGVNLRLLVGKHIWSEAQRNKGVISSGQSIYLISRHGYDIPVALRESPTSLDFPSFDSFQKNIRPYIAKLRGGASGETEKLLIEWVFHCAENSFDHASKYAGGPVQGYRGIILQKIKFEPHVGVQNRRDLPDIAKNFITQRTRNCEIGSQSIVNVITVVDLGVGVHNSILGYESASNFERLQYAFKDGVTSKNTSDNEKAGYGLGQAAIAAGHLNALLYIVSSNETAFYDFSDEDERHIPGQELALISLGEIAKTSGSAVSLMWAYNPTQDDQSSLNI